MLLNMWKQLNHCKIISNKKRRQIESFKGGVGLTDRNVSIQRFNAYISGMYIFANTKWEYAPPLTHTQGD